MNMTPQPLPARPLLQGLKAIAAFLGLRSCKTVRRLIREEGLPVHIVANVHEADPDELTAWRRSRPAHLFPSARGRRAVAPA